MRILSAIALLATVWSFGADVKAETLYEMPSCYDRFGDLWDEKSATVKILEIDGQSITNIADFSRMTGTRELGLKIIKGGNFSEWDFTRIPLNRICFDESDLQGANFAGVEGTGIGFIKSNLTGVNMQGAVMPRVLFRNARLTKVNAQNANFAAGHFDGGWFEGGVAGWNLDGATMTEFVFECGITLSDGCPVYQGGDPISARGTNFAGATLHGFGLYNVETSGAILDNTVIGPRQLIQLRGADIRGPVVLRGGNNDIVVSAEEVAELLYQNSNRVPVDANPSFDCSDARSNVEGEICEDDGDMLRLLDREVAELYKRAKRADPKIRNSQVAWLKNRNQCNDVEYVKQCINSSYSKRKNELLGLLGETGWLSKGERALFVTETLPLPREFRNSGLFRKITPALVGASMTEILVTRDMDGLYSIKGSAVGANAHLCSLGATHLYLDKESGWYRPVSEGSAIPIFRVFDGRLEIFESGRPDYSEYPDGGNYMSCGARASFGGVMQIDVEVDFLDKIARNLDSQM